jgi:galactokinase
MGEDAVFDFADDVTAQKGSWQSFTVGVVRELEKKGRQVKGFNLVFTGDIPAGAGLSSSAALENAIVMGLDHLHGWHMDKQEMIQISLKAEHNFVGVQCGIMDQFASMMGRKEQAMFLDCLSLACTYHDLHMEGYEILLINSHVHHEHATSGYNTRRAESEAGVKYIRESSGLDHIKSMRDITFEMLEQYGTGMSGISFRRCRYVLEENQRVVDSVKAFQNKRWELFGQLLYASHEGMQNEYEITCPEVDYLVEQARQHPDVIGSRMMGGGFGGCTINIVRQGCSAHFYNDELQQAYQVKFGMALSCYQVAITDGTHVYRNA